MHSAVSQKSKLILGYAVAGITFALLSTITTSVLAGAVGLEFNQDLQGISSTFFRPTDVMSVLFTALTLIIVGVYVWIFGYAGAYLKNKVTKGGSVKLQKRPRLVGLLVMGILVVGIFTLFDQILAGIDESGNFTDTGALIQAVTAFNILSVIVRIIAFAGLGFLVVWLGGKFQSVEGRLPNVLKKI